MTGHVFSSRAGAGRNRGVELLFRAAMVLGVAACAAHSVADLAAAESPTPVFVRGLNLNGPAVTIDSRPWEGADSKNYVCRDRAFENQSVTLDPPVDAATATMIRSSRWGGNRVELVGLSPGTYSVFLYVWEDNNPETFTVAVNGRDVLPNYRSGPTGHWEKLGPWIADAENGKIVLTSRGGAANFSGLELWRGRVAGGLSTEPTAGQLAFFESRVRPLLIKHCYECHGAQAKEVEGGLLLDSRDAARQGGATGPAVVPGDLERSLLIKAVRYDDDALQMPPDGKLSADEIATLETWIKTGAADPRTDSTIRPKAIDVAAAREFWSFRPMVDPPVPQVRDTSWPLGDIDRFVLAAMEARGLHPVAPADDLVWLRRVTYDLTGLPPTPEEIEEFARALSVPLAPLSPYPLISPSAGERGGDKEIRREGDKGIRGGGDKETAYRDVVERLLASRAYGERWGRHWLDVVRYADTAGDNSDYPVPQLYKYRNWVIDAVARDMPYDDFIRRQLAGDLMPAADEHERRDNLIATGYLAGARRFGSYEDARYPWHLTIEDTIDNLGRTFLGLTINCCRCHDHKFDPLTTEDYYALYGFFQSTRYPWPGIELDKAPHDLVPLVSDDVVTAVDKDRRAKQVQFDEELAQTERSKREADAALVAAGNIADQNARKERIAAAAKNVEDLDKAVKKIRRDREQFAKRPVSYETAYAVAEASPGGKRKTGDACVQIKGDPERLGPEVPRRFPTVLGGQTLAPSDASGSGRLQLADWIADPANPLTARVMVNRIWQHHFGRGLSPTSSDFGKQGQPPTHPELLDYLARRFVESGWSLKAMHRAIVLSQTYRLASGDDAANLQIDPAGEYWWRYPRRRLDAESIRDALLAAAGNLDRSPGEAHPFPEQQTWDFTQHKPFKAVYDTDRRSVYLMTQRIQRHPYLALFDGADSNAGTPRRITSTTPLQSLYLMNDPFMHRQSQVLAERLLREATDDARRLDRAFLLLFGRLPDNDEHRSAAEFLKQQREWNAAHPGDAKESASPDARAWAGLVRSLFMSNEFVYVD